VVESYVKSSYITSLL